MAINPIRKWGYDWQAGHADSGVEILWEVDSGGYDWECLALVRRWHGQADGAWQYAAYVDSGCSCSYAYESPPSSFDLEWKFSVTDPSRELVEAIRTSYYLNDGEKAEEKADLLKVASTISFGGDH